MLSTEVVKSVKLIKFLLFNSEDVVLLSDAFLTSKNITSNKATAVQAALAVGLLLFAPLSNLLSAKISCFRTLFSELIPSESKSEESALEIIDSSLTIETKVFKVPPDVISVILSSLKIGLISVIDVPSSITLAAQEVLPLALSIYL